MAAANELRAGGVSQAYDRARLIELFGDDAAVVAEIEREFLDTAREAAREIGGTDDLERIAQAAHRVKGASGMIGAEGLRQAAAAVEQAAKARDLPAVRRLDAGLSDEVARVAAQVAAS
ncbi:Hpt domain-containing protein [uncultured Reyranella sp.]|jgi:HPt (histidine-containing phosphotransfer) domain-containing protein|uniref:Hpt domain-containing protein n=1 Tax=uncultured Reyranella sp. TaxID=735512 RepID=UPI00259CBA25|nr:Hpt domain-containing protein [uncultured Reyranella sp.]